MYGPQEMWWAHTAVSRACKPRMFNLRRDEDEYKGNWPPGIHALIVAAGACLLAWCKGLTKLRLLPIQERKRESLRLLFMPLNYQHNQEKFLDSFRAYLWAKSGKKLLLCTLCLFGKVYFMYRWNGKALRFIVWLGRWIGGYGRIGLEWPAIMGMQDLRGKVNW